MPVSARFSTTVSTKGQIVLPKAIRDELGWTAGTRLIVEKRPAGGLFRREPKTCAAVFPGAANL